MIKKPKPIIKKVLDWDTLGQSANILLNIFTHARDTFSGMGIELTKLIPWLVGDGKPAFDEALKSLGEKYRSTQRFRLTNNKNVIWVNLDAPPKLPFDGAEAVENPSGGWVKVERRKTELFVDGKKIILHLDEGQKDGKVMVGTKLAEALKGYSVEHPNILDALMEHPHLIPDEFKQDGQGRTIYIFFWAVKFRERDGLLYVRCLYWGDGAWRSRYYWLGVRWGDQGPAAVRANHFDL